MAFSGETRFMTEEELFPERFINTNIDRRICRRIVPFKVIVLGMSRTGTRSIRDALRQLGYHDTYHMSSVEENPSDIELWSKALLAKFNGKGKVFEKEQWDHLLGHCQAVSDAPACAFVPELIAAYPEAKLILTPREEESWFISYQRTVQFVLMSRSLNVLSALDPQFLGRFIPFLHLPFSFLFPCPSNLLQTPSGKRIHIKNFHRLYDEARALVPPHRRLDYSVQQGWGPLCEFLEVEVPKDVGFPKVNDSESFLIWMSILKRQAVGRIIKRWSLMFVVLTAVGLAFWWATRRSAELFPCQ